MASSWSLLDPDEENQLHKSRLFSIEEKPFKRITKRLATVNQLANSKIRQTLTPPPESSNGDAAATSSRPPQENGDDSTGPAPTDSEDTTMSTTTAVSTPAVDFAQLREEITLDFAAFDYTIGRLQFLQSANAAQRERYAAERVAILDSCTKVRDSTAQLRVQLSAAQETRAQRMAWDALAKDIYENKSLQERPKALASIDKLEEECRQLEAESETYAVTWRERREQFSRIMDESMRLRRLIRDEKEEVERREGMDEDGSGEAEGAAEGHTPRPGSASGNATPRPDGTVEVASAVPKGLGDEGGLTPRPVSVGGRTPMRDSPAPSAMEGGLKPPPDMSGGFSHAGSQAGSRAGSRDPSPAVEREGREEGEDVEMDDTTTAPESGVEGQNSEDKMDTS